MYLLHAVRGQMLQQVMMFSSPHNFLQETQESSQQKGTETKELMVIRILADFL